MVTKLLIFFVIAGVFSEELHQNQVGQKSLLGDPKSWISPNDGNLVTVNTPIYGLKRKSKVSENGTVEYEILKFQNAMQKITDLLYKNQAYAIAPVSDQQPAAAESPSSEAENLIPSTTAKPEPKEDVNTLVQEMLEKRGYTNVIAYPRQTTTPEPTLPYPTIVYPEILVIIDNSFYKKFDSNIYRAVVHTLGFFNGIDLLYRNLESPKIRFNIVGILIVQGDDGLPSVEYAPNKIDGEDLASSIGKWLYNHSDTFPLDSYDIALTMTAKALFGRKNGEETLLGGISYSGGACIVDDDEHSVTKTAIVTETGDFQGIRAAAHEIGHSLGINDHDDQPEKGCPIDAGTIMSPNTASNGFKWSQCSLDQLTKTFVDSEAECLYNKPEEGKPVPRLMPGKLINTNLQCHFHERGLFAVVTENICNKLVCQDQPDRFGMYSETTYDSGAIIGSTCAQDKICLLGECVEVK